MASSGWPHRWNPLMDFSRLQKQVEDALAETPLGHLVRGQGFPPLNVFVLEDEVVLQAELPGMETEGIDITLSGDKVTIRGERPAGPLAPEATEHRRERQGGEFSRETRLPEKVDGDAADATYRAGILTVRFPRSVDSRPAKIPVE